MGIGGIIGTVLGILVLLVVGVVIWWFATMYQAIISRRNNAEDAFGELNTLLKARYQDVSATVEAMEDCCDEDTREMVLSARNSAMASATVGEQLKNEAKLEMAIEKLLLLYQDKKQEISLENQKICDNLYKNQVFINKSRQFYNSMARAYNEKLDTFPGKFWSQMKNLKAMSTFDLQTK